MPAAAIADSSLKIDGQIDELRLKKDIVGTAKSILCSHFLVVCFATPITSWAGPSIGRCARVAVHRAMNQTI